MYQLTLGLAFRELRDMRYYSTKPQICSLHVWNVSYIFLAYGMSDQLRGLKIVSYNFSGDLYSICKLHFLRYQT